MNMDVLAPTRDFPPPWETEDQTEGLAEFDVVVREVTLGRVPPPTLNRRGYYKIALLFGRTRIHYADRVVETGAVSLQFSNPQIPYWWEALDATGSGHFCLFTPEFFENFGSLAEYPVFVPGRSHVFPVVHPEPLLAVFQKMRDELSSTYVYRYDVIRRLTLELVHEALRTDPTAVFQSDDSNAARRISALFVELLERQFPLRTLGQRLGLRTPNDFADQLAVHVNHLNRSLKVVTGKTTSQLIAARVVQEARRLLTQTTWNVSEVALALGYSEPGHFVSFFKKQTGQTPKAFRPEGV